MPGKWNRSCKYVRTSGLIISKRSMILSTGWRRSWRWRKEATEAVAEDEEGSAEESAAVAAGPPEDGELKEVPWDGKPAEEKEK